MSVDRMLWRCPPFTNSKYLMRRWPCPSCNSGYLHLKPDTLHFAETHDSRNDRAPEEWNPVDFYTVYRFSGLLECKNRQCTEVVVISGRRHNYVEIFRNIDPDSGEEDIEKFDCEDFYVDYVNPSTPLIIVHENCSIPVNNELNKAFVAYWGDLSSAANHLRSGVERLLDYLGLLRWTINKKSKRIRINLHDRIKSLRALDEERGEALLAVKWLGNIGSHTDDILRDKVYDAFDVIEVVLRDVFSRSYSKIKRHIEAIEKWKERRE